ncbi:hypothetical protein ACXYMO_03855 [Arenibacterium sp. CAU 1754]
MTALARLLARATGQADAGLRPRLPARFEAGGGGDTVGFETITEETMATPTDAPAPSARADTSVRQGETPSPQASPRADAAPSLRRSAQVHDTSPRSASVPGPAPHPEPPSPLLPETATRREAQPPMAPPPPDATPAGETTGPSTHAEHPDPTPQPRQPIDPALGPLPERLQPLAPAEPQPAPHEMHLDQAMPGPTPRRAGADTAAPAPPDITVHIGRLHVVAQPSKPRSAPERPQPRRATATLGDYLRGKEDAP